MAAVIVFHWGSAPSRVYFRSLPYTGFVPLRSLFAFAQIRGHRYTTDVVSVLHRSRAIPNLLLFATLRNLFRKFTHSAGSRPPLGL